MLFQDLLAFKASIVKSAVTLISFPLDIACIFSLVVSNTLFLVRYP